MNCKKCNSNQVGREFKITMTGFVSIVGTEHPQVEDIFESFLDTEAKSRELGLKPIHIEPGPLKCFECDTIQ